MSELFTKDCKSKTITLSFAFLHLSEYSNQKIPEKEPIIEDESRDFVDW